MLFLLIRQAVVLAGVGAAAYTDVKTGLIPNRITYFMMALGIALNLFELNWGYLAVGAGVFVIGYLIYYMGKIGGGDVKLAAGIAMLLPFLGGGVFVINVLLVAAVISIIFLSVFYVSKYARLGIEWKQEMPGIIRAGFYGVVIALYFIMLMQIGMVNFLGVALLLVPVAFAMVFLALERGIRKNFFLKTVALDKLEMDEVAAEEFIDRNVRKKLGMKFKGVLGEREIKKLRELGITEVPVYRSLPPFAPFLLAGVVISFWQPNLLGVLFA